MAEYLNNNVQLVASGSPIVFNNSIGCNKGFIYHRPESGIFILRGMTNNPCNNFARYQVTYVGNIAVPTGVTVGEIGVAISVDGEPIPTSTSVSTPAEVEQYNNVISTAIIDVPRGCCFNVSVENVSEGATGAVPAPSINVRNSNLTIVRIA